MSINDIAKICHAANRAYCKTLGDDSHPAWQQLPRAHKFGIIRGVTKVANAPSLSPEELHQAWVLDKAEQGWVYGEQKDPVAKTHPNIVPWSRLSLEERTKDRLFLAIVRECLQ